MREKEKKNDTTNDLDVSLVSACDIRKMKNILKNSTRVRCKILRRLMSDFYVVITEINKSQILELHDATTHLI